MQRIRTPFVLPYEPGYTEHRTQKAKKDEVRRLLESREQEVGAAASHSAKKVESA